MKTFYFFILMLLYSIVTPLLLVSCSDNTSIEEIALREANKIIEVSNNNITLYIHGSGDTPLGWAKDKEMRYGGVSVDWSNVSKSKLQAPKNGYAVGKSIASYLNQSPKKKNLTLIAHSAGAWVAQGIADVMNDKERMSIIFLDPFTASSILHPFAGSKMLGKNAKVVVTYYTTIDSIPFTKGKVTSGEFINVDEGIVIDDKKNEAHWDVIRLYFDEYYK